MKKNGIEDIEGKKEAIAKALRLLQQLTSKVRRQEEEDKRSGFYAKWRRQRQRIRDLLTGYGRLTKTFWHLGKAEDVKKALKLLNHGGQPTRKLFVPSQEKTGRKKKISKS